MKKHSLTKILAIILLLVVVATYFIEGRSGISYLALGDVLMNFLQSFYYFFDTVIFVLVVGAFYGLLEKIPAYKKLQENIVSKVKNNDKKFIFIVIAVFAIVSSLTGLNNILLIFIPFAISLILLLGYDKFVALFATVASTMIGLIGGIFTTFKDPSNYYSTTYTTFESFVGLEDKYANIFPKIVLLIVATALLMMFVNKYISKHERVETKKADTKKAEIKESKTTSKKTKAETKKEETLVVKTKKSKTWPLIATAIIILVLLVLGFMPWSSLFEITVFDDFHTWLTGLSIGDFTVFTNIISANFTAFGNWASLGNYMMPMILLIIFSIILKFIYKIKFDDMLDGFKDGMKKMLPAAVVAMLAYTILVCVYNNGFMETIITNASSKFVDNIMISSLISILGSLTHVDLYYTTAGVFSPIVSALSDNANLQVFSIAFQSFYGLVQLIGPTSLLLIICLTYTEVSYIEWFKKIWRLVLELFIIIFIIILIVSLL